MADAPPAILHSWGRYPTVNKQQVGSPASLDALDRIQARSGTLLAYGQGRSYGDCCLNESGTLVDTRFLNRLIAFDEATGVMRCEAGTTFADILEFCVPRGWFPPTSPGTKFVSIGGAIANDVHGKNHHVAGTFGRHVLKFALLRSSGERYVCSANENYELYQATIGGLGLTGILLWADIQLRRIPGPFIDMESIQFTSLEDFFALSQESDGRYEYTMSFIDCMAGGSQLGRGEFIRGNHAWQPWRSGNSSPKQRFRVPVDLPEGLLNKVTVTAFNALRYHGRLSKRTAKTVHFDSFFYPLDSIGDWNRLYGRRGFLQHQCVVPMEGARSALSEILRRTQRAGQGSFLGVLKVFGDITSPGMLSFPRPGATLALDFPFKGDSTLGLLDELDDVVIEHGGAVYPAKDARMSSRCFRASFPRLEEFACYIDERFSSDFWRRVVGVDEQGNAP